MLRTLLIAGEQCPGGWFQYWGFVVVPGEGADGIECVEPGERDEGGFILLVMAEHVGAAEAGDAPHGWEQFGEEEAFVGVGVGARCPAAPEPGDHGTKLSPVAWRQCPGPCRLWGVGGWGHPGVPGEGIVDGGGTWAPCLAAVEM